MRAHVTIRRRSLGMAQLGPLTASPGVLAAADPCDVLRAALASEAAVNVSPGPPTPDPRAHVAASCSVGRRGEIAVGRLRDESEESARAALPAIARRLEAGPSVRLAGSLTPPSRSSPTPMPVVHGAEAGRGAPTSSPSAGARSSSILFGVRPGGVTLQPRQPGRWQELPAQPRTLEPAVRLDVLRRGARCDFLGSGVKVGEPVGDGAPAWVTLHAGKGVTAQRRRSSVTR